MSRFKDEYLPECINSYNAVSSTEFSTDIVSVDSGAESASSRWAQELNRFTIPQAVRDLATLQELRAFWRNMRGPAHTFPFRDPLDFASVDLTSIDTAPSLTDDDQVIGTGDGTTASFQLVKTYTTGSESYTREIYKPVVSSVLVSVNAVAQPSGWSISRTSGLITFDAPPSFGHIIRAGYLFDCEVRFETDQDFAGIARALQAAGFADLTLLEMRTC